MVTDLSEVQSMKAYVNISITLSGSTTSVSAVQPRKAAEPIIVTPSGMVTLVSDVQFSNALYPISVIFLPSISAGIAYSVS